MVNYCPWNGCGMPNGAAQPVPIICNCGYNGNLTSFDKFCPKCKRCLGCNRIIKKVWKENENN
jgi:hypothetical protein